MGLLNIQPGDFIVLIYTKFEISFEISPLVAVKFSVEIKAVILNLINAGEPFVAQRLFKKAAEVHFISVVIKFRFIVKQSKSAIFITGL